MTRTRQDEKMPRVFPEEVAKFIKWVHETKDEGAILCFLPGWKDIKSVMEHLEDILDRGTCLILALHSRLTIENQSKVFNTPPLHLRKIILSTNVAETSVTIDDVVYVVDCGIHKEER